MSKNSAKQNTEQFQSWLSWLNYIIRKQAKK
jgi:hypothetical protein